MSLLLPQTRHGTVQSAHVIEIHGDRYVDLALKLDDADAPQVSGRVSATECPTDLAAGEPVTARFTMGVMTRVTRS